MSVVVVDASVAVAWFVTESGSAAARELATSSHSLAAPAFLLLEVASSLARRATVGAVPRGFVGEVIRSLRRRQEIAIQPTEILIEHAASLAEELPHPIYDCLYLALAQREGATLATFDRQLAQHARNLSIPLWNPENAA